MRIRRSDCAAPGIVRRRRGRGFEYVDPDGERIDDPATLERIGELAIPPAWREVWVCLDPRGHLQATGVDAAGRKQYLYHPQWRAHRDRQKFENMLAFAITLPRLRRRVSRDIGLANSRVLLLSSEDLNRRRVTACAVRLLDLGFFRIGSEQYAEQNESFGLTTILREHVTLSGEELIFDFPAKSGQRRVQAVVDRQAVAVVRALKRRRTGSRLLAFQDAQRWTELDAEDVNDYLKQHTGGPFTAKDFRTWNATVLAAVALAGADMDHARRAARERAVRSAVKSVADHLGNTPAVTRASYIDPRLIDRFHAGVTIAGALGDVTVSDLDHRRARERVESAVIELLDGVAG